MQYLRTSTVSVALTAIVAIAQAAPAANTDAPGFADHPLIQRFTGSWLAGYRVAKREAATVPASAELDTLDRRRFKQLIELEGKVTQLLYISPPGKSPLEVWRNYEQALSAAGLNKRFVCERDCRDLYYAWNRQFEPTKGFTWSEGVIEPELYAPYSAPSIHDGRMLVGTLGKAGQEVTVLLYNSMAVNDRTHQVATYIEIIEP